ncbi:hypothetical protein LER27_31360 [Pseudomonas aeruginosa]|uniref:hypothetical protein n=1 Tax=Pseudomonas aeruginosa TaxID=287 RepID=UPI0018C6D4E3|nr:hypothetical protein [Pseudomonas aeruginosa]MBG4551262.1 hypothetical protein [Pseudomonas aeruginosa]MBI7355641.1 hypothetical protein [Pseudomonas aeruginosa]MBI8949327.1 hypothetical protein [Pseudomonas aeruginosa]MDU0543103.1 hypothetical protein [Pseudomonas aeruginosa]HBP5344614.1 hypothetical protein [Pseudomonas aeruginosa]
MDRKLKSSLEKVEICFLYLGATQRLSKENINDHAKRSVLRFFFVQIGNLLCLSAVACNLLYKRKVIGVRQKGFIKNKIAILRGSYEGSYDLIRDKVAAHSQPIDLFSLLSVWNDIDQTTIDVLYNDVEEIRLEFSKSAGIDFLALAEPDLLKFDSKISATPVSMAPSVSVDRLSLAKQNVISMVALDESQVKAQTIFSIMDFLECDFLLTAAVDNPDTFYKRMVFDIGWVLVILDLCSLVDNLFEDDEYDRSLLAYWRELNIKGHDLLLLLSQERDQELERQVRNIRNKLGAHIDSVESVSSLIHLLERVSLREIHNYSVKIVNAFCEACSLDVRTKPFLVHGMAINAVSVASDNSVPFGV